MPDLEKYLDFDESKEEYPEFEWQPWKDYAPMGKKIFRGDLEEEIKEPPCKYCTYWHPHRHHNDEGDFVGVHCCTAHDMENDFSCYIKNGLMPK